MATEHLDRRADFLAETRPRFDDGAEPTVIRGREETLTDSIPLLIRCHDGIGRRNALHLIPVAAIVTRLRFPPPPLCRLATAGDDRCQNPCSGKGSGVSGSPCRCHAMIHRMTLNAAQNAAHLQRAAHGHQTDVSSIFVQGIQKAPDVALGRGALD
jgi:hypothetical protein